MARRLQRALAEMDASYDALPQLAQDLFEGRASYTVARVDGLREWANRKRSFKRRSAKDAVAPQLRAHSQAALTIETCSVWVVSDGKLLTPEPLVLAHPEPLPGFEDIDPIPVPDVLVDPESEADLPTGEMRDGAKILKLRTSKRQLRRLAELAALNVIRVRDERNAIGHWTLAELAPCPESTFILGEVWVPALSGEDVVGADRIQMVETPLVRAVRAWVEGQIDALCEMIRHAKSQELETTERDRTADALGKFRDLMRRFLEERLVQGLEPGEGAGPGENRGIRCPRPPVKYGSVVDVIDLEPGRSSIALAGGTTVPLEFHCYELTDASERLPVRESVLELHSDCDGLVELTANRGLRALRIGHAQVWLRHPKSGIESDRIAIHSVGCTGADISILDTPLLQGQRTRVEVSFHTSQGLRDDLMLEARVHPDALGRFSRAGVFTAGGTQGTATVRVKHGFKSTDFAEQPIEIGPDSVELRGVGGGGDIPLVLLCTQPAPGNEGYEPAQRTHAGGEDFPTIIEDPRWRGVVWINPSSKEALRARVGGPQSVPLPVTSKTFLQFIALKCFEILKRLLVRERLKDQGRTQVTETEYLSELADAESECADFIDPAFDLAAHVAASTSS